MKVLFVDDQASVLEGIAASVHFDQLGIEDVRYATGAKQALELLAQCPIDVVLSDIEMPGEDGISLIRTIKEQYPEVLTVMLTSHADFEYAQESIRLGCFDYLVQPAPPEEIERVLRNVLQYIYERKKRNQLYEVGKRMQTGEMELLDGVAMNLFSTKEEDVRASLELLTLLGYAVSEEKQARVLVLTFSQFRKSETPISSEKEIHSAMFGCLKQAEISYFRTFLPLSGDSWVVCSKGGELHPAETARHLYDAASAAKAEGLDFRIYAATGDQDPADPAMTPQIEEMKKYPDVFVYDEDPTKGNLHYAVAEGEVHAYEAVYNYLYSYLPYLFQ